MALSVRIPKALEEHFKKSAKAAFPNEEYAILIGHKSGPETFEVIDLYYPADRQRFCSPHHVKVQAKWFKEARKEARSRGYRLIGDIHSHPYDNEPADASPSECDWDNAEYPKYWTNGAQIITGICMVIKKPTRWYSRVRFWPTFRAIRKKVV